MVWTGAAVNEPQVMVIAVVDGETDVEELASKVLQLREFLSKTSDTKPDPDYKREQAIQGTIKDTSTEQADTKNRHRSPIPG
ncbi:MAG: hypothetical protein AYK18_14520 [Theionarchaea archaeon DG-70]|nr:MAG: hypothetical protein AYK18_14520 [Theionarchaea archaeon DG-70]MBU7026385.1 hypothetical protein [Theionarchaea archaeon]